MSLEGLSLIASAKKKSHFCWFCGQSSQVIMQGWSLPVMLMSDFRLESPQLGEFPDITRCGKGSAAAKICEQCWQKFRQESLGTSREYLEAQQQLSDGISTHAADIATGLSTATSGISHFEYGCWFGTYPNGNNSKVFVGLSLVELYVRGEEILTQFEVSRQWFEDFVSRSPSVENLDSSLNAAAARLTRNLSFADSEVGLSDQLAIAKVSVYVLDASLLLSEFYADG